MEPMHVMQTVASLIPTWDIPDGQLVTDVEQGPCTDWALFPSDSWE